MVWPLSGSESTPLPSSVVIKLVPVALTFSLMVMSLSVASGAALPTVSTAMLSVLMSLLSELSTYLAERTAPAAKLVKPVPVSAFSKTPVLMPVSVSVKEVPLTVAVMVSAAAALAFLSRSVTRKNELSPI